MQPRCTECECCYEGRSKKHKGITTYCKLMDDTDVGASYFGRNSPRVCPKRNHTERHEGCSKKVEKR